MHTRTFQRKWSTLANQTATVWNAGSPKYGKAGTILGRDLNAGTLRIRFADGTERDESYRGVPLGDNSVHRFAVRVLQNNKLLLLGVIVGRHQPDALGRAWELWPMFIDDRAVCAGFSVVPV